MTTAEWIVGVATGYAAVGLLFGLAFVRFGVTHLDPAARGTSVAFRVLILPGSVALWPFLLWKWVSATRAPT
jgi:hypothetical protein